MVELYLALNNYWAGLQTITLLPPRRVARLDESSNYKQIPLTPCKKWELFGSNGTLAVSFKARLKL